jgi:hypothetical protein
MLNNFARRSARLLKPALKIGHSDFAIDANVSDRDVYNIPPSGNARNLLVASERDDGLSYSLFIEISLVSEIVES